MGVGSGRLSAIYGLEEDGIDSVKSEVWVWYPYEQQ
jgi:hypothetical protein